MLLPSNGENGPEAGPAGTQPTPENVTGFIDRASIEAQLKDFSRMNGQAMLDTLVPHQELPSVDPAAYVIRYHRGISGAAQVGETDPQPTFESTYDLGVVFGRSLLRRSVPDSADIPIINQDLYPNKLTLVDKYLEESANRSVRKLVSNDDLINKHLKSAVKIFIKRCESELGYLMIDGSDELERGFHDYLSVIALLDTPRAEEANILRRVLGKFSLRPLLRWH